MYLVRLLLVPMPCATYLIICLAQFNGIIGIALKRKPIVMFQVYTSENLVPDPEHKGGLIKGEIFCDTWQRETIMANALYVVQAWHV